MKSTASMGKDMKKDSKRKRSIEFEEYSKKTEVFSVKAFA